MSEESVAKADRQSRAEDVRAAWNAGVPADVIADGRSMPRSTVRSILRRARLSGKPVRSVRGGKMEAAMDRVLPLWKGGLTSSEIAKECGISPEYVAALIRRAREAGRIEARYRRKGPQPSPASRVISPGMRLALAGQIDEAIQEMIYDDERTAKALLRQVAAALRGEAE